LREILHSGNGDYEVAATRRHIPEDRTLNLYTVRINILQRPKYIVYKNNIITDGCDKVTLVAFSIYQILGGLFNDAVSILTV
jgi:hypothetical protein